MRVLLGVGALALIVVTLLDGFNTIVLPRRVRHLLRPTGIFYRLTWAPFAAVARHIASGIRREDFLSVYGPLSILILLFGWAISLILGFGLLHYSLGLEIDGHPATLPQALYVSASSLLMIATGAPGNPVSKWLVTAEAGLGFSFLGLTVGYLPVLYQSYSSRELHISLLDARAGSPPTAGELLRRQGQRRDSLSALLSRWEEWMAELLQEQLSYPMLAYFRSQHQNQSWLGALTAIVDASAIVSLCTDDELRRQAQLTFAIGRHALVDLATIFHARPGPPSDRLSHAGFAELRRVLERSCGALRVEGLSEHHLHNLRAMYEPFAGSLGEHFLIALPGWLPDANGADNWLSTQFDRRDESFAVSDPYAEH